MQTNHQLNLQERYLLSKEGLYTAKKFKISFQFSTMDGIALRIAIGEFSFATTKLG